MKTKLLSIALIGTIALFLSSWTAMAPVGKTVTSYNFSLPWSGTIYNPCSGEDVDYEGDIHFSGKLTVWDDGRVHNKWHVNYQGIFGIGQTSGDSYHWTGGWNGHYNANVGETYTFTRRVNNIHQGGENLKVIVHNHFTVNANGELTTSTTESGSECY